MWERLRQVIRLQASDTEVQHQGGDAHRALGLLRALSSWGNPFIVTNQGFDTRQEVPTSLLLLPFMTAVADFEREMIRERVKAGLDTARNKGLKVGQPKVVFERRMSITMRRRALSL